MLIPQSEANYLLSMPKGRENDDLWHYPLGGGYLRIPLISEDQHERFTLDIERHRLRLEKGKYQHRARQIIILARLCFGTGQHTNPGEDTPIGCPHLHVYREGHGDKFAFPLPPDQFTDISDLTLTLQQFMAYCNIVREPHIDFGMFS